MARALRLALAITDFLLFSSLFIAFVAIVMVQETCRLLLQEPASFSLLGFVFFSTLCSYNFHWYLSPVQTQEPERSSWTRLHTRLHLLFFLAGAAGSAYFAFTLLPYWIYIWPAALLTFLYSAPKIKHPFFQALKKWAFGKTLYLAAVWTYVSTVLPVWISPTQPDASFPLFLLSRFTLVFALCLLFDQRDREEDRREGIRSLITFLSPAAVERLLFLTLLAFAIFTLGLAGYNYSYPVLLALLLPGLLTLFFSKKAKNTDSDYFYYGLLDGLMMLSGCITFFLPI